MKMQDAVVQGMIAAIVSKADRGELSDIRLELRDFQGNTDTYLTGAAMMRSHSDPAPMSIDQAIRLIESAGLRVSMPAQRECVG